MFQTKRCPNFGTPGQGNTLSILLGQGDGTFVAARTVTVGRGPQSIAVGDFNEDGIPDLAVANFYSNNVSILLGNGDGTFQPARTLGVEGNARSVVVGDFNQDHHLDLAVVVRERIPDKVSILLGQGDGTFSAPQSFAVGTTPTSLIVGDFNGDAVLDLAVAHSTNTVALLLGRGDGTFNEAQFFGAGNQSVSIAVADFNGDNLPDLATANFWSHDVSILINDTPTR